MRLGKDFFRRDAMDVAADLLGKNLCWITRDGEMERKMIIEVEVYRGEEDKACHACRGKTERNKVMYLEGGLIYVYLIYGMYWMLNIVTGKDKEPQAILIRGLEGVNGPGKVGKLLGLDKSFYGESLVSGGRLWVEAGKKIKNFEKLPRVGVDYAGEWAKKLWRFRVKE